jgi:hypothetical protein
MIATPAARLLVLVPEGDLPVVELAERVWRLAVAAGAAVLLVGLVRAPEQEPRVRLNLTLLESHIRYADVPVSTRVAQRQEWVAAVEQLRRRGDCVVVLSGGVGSPYRKYCETAWRCRYTS